MNLRMKGYWELKVSSDGCEENEVGEEGEEI